MAVPFFSTGTIHKYYTPKNSLKTTPFMKYIKSLQVPGNFPLIQWDRLEKRALPFTSPVCPASLTIEAALSLSFYVLMAAAMLQPLFWLDRQRKIQTAAEVFCGELSQYAYVEKFLSDDPGIWEENGEEENLTEGGNYFNGAAASLWILSRAKEAGINMASVRVRKAEIPDEEANICLELEYREKIPFFPLAPGEITMNAAVKRRAWIGINGKLKGNGSEPWEDNEKSEDVLVYVGANMGRYHWYRDCHYISNRYQSVSADQISKEKNIFGKKYTACSSCAPKGGLTGSAAESSGGSTGGVSGQIYITSGGEHYHTTPDCKAMVSYVREVPLKEVEYLGACSYCSRRKGE